MIRKSEDPRFQTMLDEILYKCSVQARERDPDLAFPQLGSSEVGYYTRFDFDEGTLLAYLVGFRGVNPTEELFAKAAKSCVMHEKDGKFDFMWTGHKNLKSYWKRLQTLYGG